jgi:sigma-B regulation protein RsbU (phosphoserine phosphatase)
MTPGEERLLEVLLSRRERLAEAAAESPEERLVELLRRVDSALGREVAEWSLCRVCGEQMSPEQIAADPLIKVCLECLSPEERRALERDLEKAAGVQRTLLPPRELAHSGWEAAWLWEPRGAVSGDHIDFLPPRSPGDPVHLLLGDVAGKGVAASFLQAHLHALFRALAGPDIAIDELLSRVNRHFFEATSAASYATLIALRLDPDGRVELANAGHPRPLLADRRGVRPIEGSGLPLGLFQHAEYVGREVRLAPGDTLLLYSDGLTEAARDEEEYGIGRAAAALRRAARLPLAELLTACRLDLETFLEGTPRSDDLSLLAVRRAASPS